MSLENTYRKIEAAFARGYADRLAHKPGQTEFEFANERRAYEDGAAKAEREMGFKPKRGTTYPAGLPHD